MDETTRKKALTFSIVDGALSTVMGSLAGGIFLMGFALKVLNASPQQIGILTSLPLLANLVQLIGSYIIEKTGTKKTLCFWSVLVARLFWILILMLPLALFSPIADWRIWVLIGVIGVSSLFNSLAGVAWLAWISDLVPENIRGSYFGKRNMIASACGMVTLLAGGKFIAMWADRSSETDPYGFLILFSIGILMGLVSVWFVWQIPESESSKKAEGSSFQFSVFLVPLKNKNFLALILFVAAWLFAIQIAGPFYGVFMIENLKMDFSTMAIFGTFATFATFFMMRIWGPLSDKLGNKPVIMVSTGVLAVVPFIWVLAIPENYYVPVLIAHLLSGAFMAGAGLSQFNILIKLSPKEGRSVYLALFGVITSLVGACAPVIGGTLSGMLEGISFKVSAYEVSNLHFIFLISAVLLGLSLFLLLRLKEPSAASPVAVIMQLRNDLNPQTGLASSSDFVLVELKRTEGILKKLDRTTDELAEKSEAKIAKVLDFLIRPFEKPIKKLKRFFWDED